MSMIVEAKSNGRHDIMEAVNSANEGDSILIPEEKKLNLDELIGKKGTPFRVANECRHAIVNLIASNQLCAYKSKNTVCDTTTKKIVAELDVMLAEIRKIEIEDRR
jgi:hypothetical protein